jgi:hypothetical protein
LLKGLGAQSVDQNASTAICGDYPVDAVQGEEGSLVLPHFSCLTFQVVLAVPVQKDGDGAAGQSVTYQLPWVAAPLPIEPTKEERARKAEQKERNRERLKEMAAAKKAARVSMPEQYALTMVSKVSFLLKPLLIQMLYFWLRSFLCLPLVTGSPARWTVFSHLCNKSQVPHILSSGVALLLQISTLEADVAGLEHLLDVTEGASESRVRAFLQQTGYRAEVGEYLAKNEATLRRLRGEEGTPTKDEEDPADMLFPLLEVRRGMERQAQVRIIEILFS